MTGSPEPLSADFAALLRHVREKDAVDARIRERHLRASAAGDATLAGTLLALAERGVHVVIRTTAGRLVHGPVRLVGRDVVAVGTTLVATRAIGVVRTEWGVRIPDTSDDRDVADRVTLAAVLGDLAAFRPRVSLVVTGDPAPLTGELRSAGVDVLTVRVDGAAHVAAHVALAQLSELTVLASG